MPPIKKMSSNLPSRHSALKDEWRKKSVSGLIAYEENPSKYEHFFETVKIIIMLILTTLLFC